MFDENNSVSTRVRITDDGFADRVLAQQVIDIPFELFAAALDNRDQDIVALAREDGEREGRRKATPYISQWTDATNYETVISGLENPGPVALFTTKEEEGQDERT